MPKYMKRPIVIEVFKWTGDMFQTEDPEWIVTAIQEGVVWFDSIGTENVTLKIETLEGTHTANRGDFIIKGIKGELYPCKPDIFEASYMEVKE